MRSLVNYSQIPLVQLLLGINIAILVNFWVLPFFLLAIRKSKWLFIIGSCFGLLITIRYQVNVDIAKELIGSQVTSHGYVISDVDTERLAVVQLDGQPMFTEVKLPGVYDFKAGQRVALTGKIIDVPDNRRSFYASRKVYSVLEVAEIKVLDEYDYSYLGALMRSYIKQVFRHTIDFFSAEVAIAFTIGDDGRVDKEFIEMMRQTGSLHLLAVSGFNVALVIFPLRKILALKSNRISLVTSLIAVILFALTIGGGNISAMRAAFMLGVFLVGKLCGYKTYFPLVLMLASTFFLIENPLVYQDVSFQLSFGALCGIGLFEQYYTKLMSKYLPSFLASSLGISFAASMVTVPIIFLHFGEISIIGPVATALLGILFLLMAYLSYGMVVLSVLELHHLLVGTLLLDLAVVKLILYQLALFEKMLMPVSGIVVILFIVFSVNSKFPLLNMMNSKLMAINK